MPCLELGQDNWLTYPSPGKNAPDENRGAGVESAVSHCMHAQGTGIEISSGFRTGHRAQLQNVGSPMFRHEDHDCGFWSPHSLLSFVELTTAQGQDYQDNCRAFHQLVLCTETARQVGIPDSRATRSTGRNERCTSTRFCLVNISFVMALHSARASVAHFRTSSAHRSTEHNLGERPAECEGAVGINDKAD